MFPHLISQMLKYNVTFQKLEFWYNNLETGILRIPFFFNNPGYLLLSSGAFGPKPKVHSILDSWELIPMGTHANPPIHIHQIKIWEVANGDRCWTQDLSASRGAESLANWATTQLVEFWEFYRPKVTFHIASFMNYRKYSGFLGAAAVTTVGNSCPLTPYIDTHMLKQWVAKPPPTTHSHTLEC